MSECADPKPDPEDLRQRFSVADANGVHQAVVTLEIGGHGRVEVRLSGDAPLDPLTAVVETFAKAREETPHSASSDLAQAAGELAEAFRRAGHTTEELPSGDIAVETVFDFKTGLIVSRQQPMHSLADLRDETGKSIQRALGEAFAELGRHALQAVSEPLARGDHHAAAAGLQSALDGGALAFASGDVLDAALRIDAGAVDAAAAKSLRLTRLALAAKLGRYADGEADALALVKPEIGLSPVERVGVENALGVILNARGAREAAIRLWRGVTVNEEVAAGERAWAWRNLSMALPPHEPEAALSARASADAFLEAGAKRDAVTSLLQLCEIFGRQEPAVARTELERLPALIDRPGLLAQVERATLHHALGNRFLALRNAPRARTEADAAIGLLRGVHGAEEQLISSMHLAAIAAGASGDAATADALRTEAEDLVRRSGSAHFQIGARISALLQSFDAAEGQAVIVAARASGNPELWMPAELAVALHDPSLDAPLRLARLERLHEELVSQRADGGLRKLVELAIATVLRQDGDLPRAAIWLQRVLTEDPGALDARDMFLQVLRQDGRWTDLACFLKSQIDLHGEMPGLLTAYGEALLEAGDASAALTAIGKALKLVPQDDDRRPNLLALRDRAFDQGGTVQPPTLRPSPGRPVLRDDLEAALAEYADYISGAQRMTFWGVGADKKHAWIPNPERHSQTLLHTFLKARFGKRVEVFEEVGAGAGRLDLLVRLEGGLQAILELKMCGFTYSSTYAAAGEEQIRHYMEARKVRLGYLVVHDARLEAYAAPLLSGPNDADTVLEVFVDVRPRVSNRRAQGARFSGGRRQF